MSVPCYGKRNAFAIELANEETIYPSSIAKVIVVMDDGETHDAYIMSEDTYEINLSRSIVPWREDFCSVLDKYYGAVLLAKSISLDMSYCHLRDEDIAALVAYLSTEPWAPLCQALTKLIVRQNRITKEGFQTLFAFLESRCPLCVTLEANVNLTTPEEMPTPPRQLQGFTYRAA